MLADVVALHCLDADDDGHDRAEAARSATEDGLHRVGHALMHGLPLSPDGEAGQEADVEHVGNVHQAVKEPSAPIALIGRCFGERLAEEAATFVFHFETGELKWFFVVVEGNRNVASQGLWSLPVTKKTSTTTSLIGKVTARY